MSRVRIAVAIGITASLAVCAGLFGAGGMGTTKWIPVAPSYGGESNSVHQRQNVSAFAALKADGSVVTWGNAGDGGSTTTTVPTGGTLTGGVTQIFSTFYAFAALKADGSVVTWGDAGSGGSTTSPVDAAASLTSGVTQIFSNEDAFAALKADGSVVTWGNTSYGGSTITPAPTGGTLTSGVTQIFSTYYGAFAALKADGSVVTWGDTRYGGSNTTRTPADAILSSGVETIASPLFRPAYLPGAPTQGAVAEPAAGETTVVVSFLAPGANGGTPITGYRATCSSSTGGGEAEATTSSTDSLRISVEGLTLGATYTCAVRARNIVGDGQPSAASNSFITSAPAAPAVARELSPLRSSLTCRGNTCTTRGPVPPGATAVTQRATTSAAQTAQSREMAKPKVKTAKGTCRITKRGKGKKATRTYQCTIRLSKGKWTITTKALKKTTVIAQSVKTKKVK